MKVYISVLIGGNGEDDWTHVVGVYRHQRSAADVGSRMARRCNEFLRGVPKWDTVEKPMGYDRAVVRFKDGYEDLREVEDVYGETVFVPDDALDEVVFQVWETKMMEMR